MKQQRTRYRLAALLALILLAGLSPAAQASPAPAGVADLRYLAQDGAETTAVTPQWEQGGRWLFLPASADLTALRLWFEGGEIQAAANGRTAAIASGQPFDLAELFPQPPEDGRYAVTLTRGQETAELTIMKSAGVGSLYITSPDGAHDRAWVELDKDNKAAGGGVALLRPDGTQVYSGTLKNIKGRGNSTWHYPKRPYQIKLGEKIDLLETGDPGEAASTWVLLANYNDETLIHNSLTYDLAAELGLPYSPHSKAVDLYYDGQYRGSYLLCEKTEVGSGRVDIRDLEKEIEKANPDAGDFDLLETGAAVSESGLTYQYVSGLALPEDISGGYLLELDMKERALEEKSWFSTTRGNYVVCKSPEYLPAEAVEYIGGLYQEFEDAVYNGGVHPVTGKAYSEYVDAESLAKCYLLMELSQNGDAFLSSTYFYKPADEEKLYAGPVWDFDYTYGLFGSRDNGAVLSSPEGLTAALNSRFTIKLLSIPAFQEEVQRVYREELYELVTGVALGGAEDGGERLRPLDDYGAQCAASQEMNRVLWTQYLTGSYAQALEKFRDFLERRNEWLYAEVTGWTGDPLDTQRFVDVGEDQWYFEAVSFVERQGLFHGVSETRFDPRGVMSRAMAVTVLHRLAGTPEPAGAGSFLDVPQGAYYAEAVAWAQENQIIEGDGGGYFRPDRPVSREELVTILYRWAQADQAPGGDAPAIPDRFADRGTVSDWARAAFGWAIDRQILLGRTETTLAPRQDILRCEAAAVFQRFAQGQGG